MSAESSSLLDPYNTWRARESLKVAIAVALCLLVIINFQIDDGFMALLVITVFHMQNHTVTALIFL